MKLIRNRCVELLALATLLTAAAIGIRSVAQTTNPLSNAAPTNAMSRYVEGVKEAVVSGTAATNLADVDRGRLMNESIKTNLAAQLWFRVAMSSQASSCGARMAVELRALESLRAGRTNDAIRHLEEDLDGEIIVLSEHLRAGDQTGTFKTTHQPVTALQWAKDYREKFPHKSGDPTTDERVKAGLSYVEKK
jgi:hypothetical protein